MELANTAGANRIEIDSGCSGRRSDRACFALAFAVAALNRNVPQFERNPVAADTHRRLQFGLGAIGHPAACRVEKIRGQLRFDAKLDTLPPFGIGFGCGAGLGFLFLVL